MAVRDLVAGRLVKIGSSKVTISSATTTSFDFGTPDDINLAGTSGQPGNGYRAGDRILIVFTATTVGTTDTASFVVQDADDSSGSIGTPATAVTDGTLTGGVGPLQTAFTFMRVQPARPWIRCRVTSTGATDTIVTTATVYAVSQAGSV